MSMVVGEAIFGVGFLIHKIVELSRILYNDFYDPGFERVLIDEFWVAFEREVYFGDLAVDRRKEVGCSLAAFDGTEFFTGFEFVAVLGHVDIGDGAELFRCVFRYADVSVVALDFDILVCGKVIDFFHGRFIFCIVVRRIFF